MHQMSGLLKVVHYLFPKYRFFHKFKQSVTLNVFYKLISSISCNFYMKHLLDVKLYL